jgi:hypothetical protein
VAKSSNLLVAWAEVGALFLNQMTLVDEYKAEPVTELGIDEQRFEAVTRQHLWRDDHKPVLPVYRLLDWVSVFIE